MISTLNYLRFFTIATSVALVMSGCEGDTEPLPGEVANQAPLSNLLCRPAAPMPPVTCDTGSSCGAAACPLWARVAALECNGPCGDAKTLCDGLRSTGWTSEPLLPADTVFRPSRVYCRVRKEADPSGKTATSPSATPPAIAALPSDCMAVRPLATPDPSMNWPSPREIAASSLEHRFLAQVGKLSQFHLRVRRDHRQVRLAVLDAAPTLATRYSAAGNGVPISGPDFLLKTAPHGEAMTNLARRLVCDSVGCLVHLTSRQALRYTTFDPTDSGKTRISSNGGHVGTISDLARTIAEELTAWKRDQPAARLVINLSLGWDGEQFTGSDFTPTARATWTPAVRAVYEALEAARCMGALVVAAAGNQADLLGSQRPLLPAAWEQAPAPDMARCKALVPAGHLALPTMLSSPQPLLVAAGGVDHNGEPLANALHGGLPRLAAYSDHAVVQRSVPVSANPGFGGVPINPSSPPTKSMTGSSVAAVVVSATAAALWSQDTSRTAQQLVNTLHANGKKLNYSANFCVSPPCDSVRKIMLDQVIAGTDNGTGKRIVPLASLLHSAFGVPTLASGFRPADGGPVCRAGQLHAGLTRYSWVKPQPGNDPVPPFVVARRMHNFADPFEHVRLDIYLERNNEVLAELALTNPHLVLFYDGAEGEPLIIPLQGEGMIPAETWHHFQQAGNGDDFHMISLEIDNFSLLQLQAVGLTLDVPLNEENFPLFTPAALVYEFGEEGWF